MRHLITRVLVSTAPIAGGVPVSPGVTVSRIVPRMPVSAKRSAVGKGGATMALLAMGCAAALLATGCDGGDPRQTNLEYLPEMIDSLPYDSFAPNPNTRDGKTLMAPPRGAIPRGFAPLHYGPGPEEAARAGRELTSPLPDAPEHVARGKVLFKRFCTRATARPGQGTAPSSPLPGAAPAHGGAREEDA